MKLRTSLLLQAAIAAAALPFTTAGCASSPTSGYTFDTTFDESVRSVAVPVFANQTEFIGLEQLLTEAIALEIQRSTPWTVSAPASADTEIQGAINRAEYQTLSSRRGTGLVEEQAFTLIVSFSWRDSRTGEIRVTRTRFRASGTSVQSLPTRERVEVGQREAISEMAAAIVRELRSEW